MRAFSSQQKGKLERQSVSAGHIFGQLVLSCLVPKNTRKGRIAEQVMQSRCSVETYLLNSNTQGLQKVSQAMVKTREHSETGKQIQWAQQGPGNRKASDKNTWKHWDTLGNTRNIQENARTKAHKVQQQTGNWNLGLLQLSN